MLAACSLVGELGVFSREPGHADRLARHCGAVHSGGLADLAGWTGWIMLATSDDAIAACAGWLGERVGEPEAGAVAFHCSGSLPASVLGPLADRGWQVGSLHPARSFRAGASEPDGLEGVVCGVEGMPGAVKRLSRLVECLGGQPMAIASDGKHLYHAASVIAHNYTAVLVDIATRVAADAGLSSQQAGSLLQPLMMQAMRDSFANGAAAVLTGPAVRGDTGVIQAHVRALRESDPKLAQIYAELGMQAATLAFQQGALTESELAALRAVLSRAANRRP